MSACDGLVSCVANSGDRGKDCPRGDYSPLHYWTPQAYKLRAFVHPSNLDQYPPGPSEPVPAGYEWSEYRCPSLPPMPKM